MDKSLLIQIILLWLYVEIVANQIVHQDFSVKGSSPTIEIFDNRVVFTNPGSPLNRPERLLDMPPSLEMKL